MEFRTIVPILKTTKRITYHSQILSIGSCFAVNMAQRFSYYKIPVTVNPFGILFHPLAIENVLSRAIEHTPYEVEDFFLYNELWHSFDFHSDMSKPNLEEAVHLANIQQTALYNTLQKPISVYHSWYSLGIHLITVLIR